MAVKSITLDVELINNTDLSDVKPFIEWNVKNAQYFDLDAGKEHYKLIAYIAQQLSSGFFVDIGTYFGFSAAALSVSKDAKVVTYDVCDWIPDDDSVVSIKKKDNITMKLMNCVNDMDEILKTDFIVLDIDPHDGVEETNILNALRSYGYKGVVLLDDINLNDDMKKFWTDIPEQKYDVSKYGHWSGTGLVVFDSSRFHIELH